MNDYGIVPILCTEGNIHFLTDNLTNDWSLENTLASITMSFE